MFQQKPLKSHRRGRGGGEAALSAGLFVIRFLVLEKMNDLISPSKSRPRSFVGMFCEAEELIGGSSSMSGGFSLRLRVLEAFSSNDLRRLGREEDCGRLCIEHGMTSVQRGLFRQKTVGSWRVRLALIARPSWSQEDLPTTDWRLETTLDPSRGAPASEEEDVALLGGLHK